MRLATQRLSSSLSIALTLTFVLPLAAEEQILWQPDFGDAQQIAAESGKPLFIHFQAKWCGPCKKLERTVFSNREFAQEVNENLIAVMIDIDREPELAKEYGISVLPADVYLKPDGKTIASGPSPLTLDDYQAIVGELIAYRTKVPIEVASRRAEIEFSEIRQPSAGLR